MSVFLIFLNFIETDVNFFKSFMGSISASPDGNLIPGAGIFNPAASKDGSRVQGWTVIVQSTEAQFKSL